jgi:hypothetical protein
MSYKNNTIQYAILISCLIGLLFSFTPIAARLPKQIAHLFSNNHHSNNDRFTRIGTEWPPQPKQMDNVVWLGQHSYNRIVNQTISSVGFSATARSFSNNDIRELGNRFTFVGTKESGGKQLQSSQQTMTYYSHTNNATVEVEVNQGDIQNVTLINPSKYQPPLTDEEVKEAVNIARTSISQDGYDRIQQLNGYGILAFKPKSEIQPGDSGFYDTRMVYVSFHEHIDARPEFIAWVDLAQQIVIKSGEDQL